MPKFCLCECLLVVTENAEITPNAPNVSMHIVTGCLCPTPMDYLPILAGVQPV